MKAFLRLAISIFVLSLVASVASRADEGPSNDQFVLENASSGNFSIPYAVYLPVGYTSQSISQAISQKRWPVILSLHGTGECGKDGWAPTHVGLGQAILDHPERFPAIVIFPQIPCGLRWTSQVGTQTGDPSVRDLVLTALDRVLSKYHGDLNRVTLTGVSLGGQGVWDLGAREPHRFVALMPIAGRRIAKNLIPALVEKPIWVFQGAKDDVVPVEESRYMVDQLTVDGAKNVRFTELPGLGHDVWDTVYAEPQAIEFLIR
jgi:predicted peptidase